MAGIYVHIPFCKQACQYCNFHFSTSLLLKNDLIGALLKEAELRTSYLAAAPIETVYLGGGTPSLLDPEEIHRILRTIRNLFVVMADAEITLEANPDDVTAWALERWKEAGVNRLSLGIQSFHDRDLSWMNRAHSASQAQDSIALARRAGIDNLTIDLIYGIPGSRDAEWKANVDLALEMGVQHLSCYGLTVEPKTQLSHRIRRGLQIEPSQNDQARQFLLLLDWLETAGFEHYEISNFARPGHRSRHNTSYWKGIPYLGLGPSAHSFDGVSRQWNVSNNARYLRGVGQGAPMVERELLTDLEHFNELVLTRLRTSEGLELNMVLTRFGPQALAQLKMQAAPYLHRGQLLEAGGQWRLSREGRLWADRIASDLFLEKDFRAFAGPNASAF